MNTILLTILVAAAAYLLGDFSTGITISRLQGVDIRKHGSKNTGASNALRTMGEHDRFLRGMWAWVGFEQIAMPYERQERFAGKTKYSLKKMLRLAANGIFSFSSRPLTAIGITGVALMLLGLAALVLMAVLGIFGVNIATWLIVLAGNAVFTGLVLTALGIMGAYLSRIYDESKNRPLYILSRKWGFDMKEEDEK